MKNENESKRRDKTIKISEHMYREKKKGAITQNVHDFFIYIHIKRRRRTNPPLCLFSNMKWKRGGRGIGNNAIQLLVDISIYLSIYVLLITIMHHVDKFIECFRFFAQCIELFQCTDCLSISFPLLY